MIFYGRKASQIGKFQITGTTCNHCESTSTQDVSVFGKYAHLYWIPLFPMGKEAVAECTNCKKTILKEEFSSSLASKYKEQSRDIKSPFTHWAGLAIVLAGISLMTFLDATKEVDPRHSMLLADAEMMSSSPDSLQDSIAFQLHSLMQVFLVEEMEAEEMSYLTKVNGDKMLTLIEMPKIIRVEKSERSQMFEMVEMVLDNSEGVADKEKYIGVMDGDHDLMLVKVGDHEENAFDITTGPIYDFYGPKPVEAE